MGRRSRQYHSVFKRRQAISHQKHGHVYQQRIPSETAQSGVGRQLDLDKVRTREGLDHYLLESNLTKAFPTGISPYADGREESTHGRLRSVFQVR